MTLNREQLREKISQHIIQTLTVHINEWDSDVFVREMNGKQFVEVTSKCVLPGGSVDNSEFFIYVIIESVFDLNNEPLFDNTDHDMVKNLSADVYSDLVTAISKLNHIGASNSKN
jgi:hypothetical protein